MSLYLATVPPLKKTLTNLERWLDAATHYATEKGFDVNVLVHARLAPDQYALVRQVQSSCDSAKFATARMIGKEAPKHPDTEQTMPELKARVGKVLEYLAAVTEADFAGAKERHITLPFLEGRYLLAADYLNEMALPNFYFHVTMAYAILRHNGVNLGKRDFIGELTTHPLSPANS
jgi:uncharacterized protein